MMKSKLLLLTVLATTTCVLFSGCALLEGMTGTKTQDSNPINQLGPYNGLKHAVGVKDFQNQGGWAAQWKLGNNLSIMLESALGATERFVMVEREALKDVIAEQDLAGSARVAAAKKVAKTGLIRPARYLATGAITGVEDNTSGSGGGISVGGFTIGGSKGKAKITVIVKLIDTTTGEIAAQQRVTGTAGKVGLKVGMYKHGVGGNFGSFAKTPLAEAAQDCMNQAAVFIAKKMEEMPFEGAVVKASGKTVIINRGAEFGVTVGTELVMKTLGDLLTDPDTGAILGREDGDEIGKLKVTKVTPKMSYCIVTSGDKSPKTGTPVYQQ